MLKLRQASVFAVAAVGILGLSAAGCSDKTEQAADNATASAGNAMQGAAEDTARNTEKVGEAAAAGAKEVGSTVAEGAREAGKSVAVGTEKVVEGAADLGATATLTAKVKNAYLVDKTISAYKLNVDTMADSKTVVVKGTAPSTAEKMRISDVGQKVLEGSGYTLQNDVMVK